MQVSVEKLSSIEYKLTIVVPGSTVQTAIQDEIQSLSKTISRPGFRKGKVPVDMIKKMYGQEVERDAFGQVTQRSLIEALSQEKLRPVGSPRVQFKRPPVVGQDLEFTANVEILPTITDLHFSLEEIEKPIVSITEEDVDRVVLQLQKQYAEWKPVERTVKTEDRVVVDFHPVFEGKEEKGVSGHVFEVGSKSMIPGFEEGVIGMSIGEEKTLNLAFPEDFANPERAGKPVQFVVKLIKLFEANIPELDSGFVKKLGIASGETSDFRDNIRKTLEQERDRLVRERIKTQVFDHLIEKNEVLLPSAMIQEEAANLHDQIYGHDHDHAHHQHSPEEVEQLKNIAKKRLTLGLLITEKAKALGIEANDQLVEKRAREIASVYQEPESVYEWLMKSERKSGIVSQILEEQVVDRMIETLRSNEKHLSYAELKGIQI